ncbi:MAG TPA: hypothetical protein VLQ91_17805 [Draconibacterium sp.]|nr:hypothetical protein [Draconibacterium sp.]
MYPVTNIQIAKDTVILAEMLIFKHEFEFEEYITFEVAKMQNSDKFGMDHLVVDFSEISA